MNPNTKILCQHCHHELSYNFHYKKDILIISVCKCALCSNESEIENYNYAYSNGYTDGYKKLILIL